MIVNYFQDPTPHFIIDEFLTHQNNRAVLAELIDNEDKFQDSRIGGIGPNTQDDCPECKKLLHYQHNTVRRNKVIYLSLENMKTWNKGELFNLHGILKEAIFGSYLPYVLHEKANTMFPIISACDSMELIGGNYGKCEFYGWHKDPVDGIRNERILTCVYYCNTEPQQFTGGEIVLAYPNLQTQKIIEVKNNRAVIFISDTLHQVKHVTMKSDQFMDNRFVINCWLGIKGRESLV